MSVESVLLQFLKELIRKIRAIDLLWASGRPLQKKGLNCSKTTFLLQRLRSFSTGNIPVFGWLAIATGDFGVQHGFDLVEQLGTFPCSGPGPALWLGCLVGDLTIFQEIYPLTLA